MVKKIWLVASNKISFFTFRHFYFNDLDNIYQWQLQFQEISHRPPDQMFKAPNHDTPWYAVVGQNEHDFSQFGHFSRHSACRTVSPE